ncbi:hypothetical protein BLIN101_01305 [Brevibacterium linens]|uniref:Uncharacterized protein n=1 Tax=Brevibacterium linens TaxID=1703 RepID=A0A2H1IKV0_BRELN|nr:hypothetical protein [Brevibacterium linens]SMX75784.1 hypothetical protein BLIN101_01305 [Brevibacterium linens]
MFTWLVRLFDFLGQICRFVPRHRKDHPAQYFCESKHHHWQESPENRTGIGEAGWSGEIENVNNVDGRREKSKEAEKETAQNPALATSGLYEHRYR